MKKDHRIGNKFRQTHGLTNSPEFYIWRSMKARCLNPNTQSYKRYGGRGIKVCKRWLNCFENFYEDMGPRPSKRHQIDRINNDENYSPKNCRWVSPEENGSNRNNNRTYTFKGKTMTVTQWAKRIGLNRGAIQKRLAKGWSIEDALTIPKLPRHLRRSKPEKIKIALNLNH